jgi:uncharacterized membrane protein
LIRSLCVRSVGLVRASWVPLAVVALAVMAFVSPQAFAAITIPDSLNVDSIGTSTLNTAAPGILSVIGFKVILILVGSVVAIVYGFSRRRKA